MAKTRIQLCGKITAEISGRRVEQALPGRQGRLLFAYLVANRARTVSRDELTGAVWPRAAPAAVDTALNALLSKLRSALAPIRIEGRGAVEIELPADAWVDLEAAVEALHRAESAVALERWSDAWAPAHVASYIAARELLVGEEAPWVEDLRHHLEAVETRGLECLAISKLHVGGTELAGAERAARRLIQLAPYRESGFRLLMELNVRIGNDAEAARVYDQLRCRLRDDLGIAPSASTQAMLRELLGVPVAP